MEFERPRKSRRGKYFDQKRKREKDNKKDELEPELEKRIKKSKCLINKNIPAHLRRTFAEIETNPLKVLITNIPTNVTVEEMRAYFSTFILTLKPEWEE